jgi:hypothetical protein
MHSKTSAQQRRAAVCLPHSRRRMSARPLLASERNEGKGAGRLPVGVRLPLNENKLAIATQLGEVDHPMTAGEIQEALGELLPLSAIEYHLSTLVVIGIAKPLFSPEIYFERVSHKSGAVSAYGVQAH